MPGWSETDLEALLNDPFSNDGPLVFNGRTTGCIIKQHDEEMSGLGPRDVAVRVIECYYAEGAFTSSFTKPPTIGSQVTVAGVTYDVQHKFDKPAGLSCLYLVAAP